MTLARRAFSYLVPAMLLRARVYERTEGLGAGHLQQHPASLITRGLCGQNLAPLFPQMFNPRAPLRPKLPLQLFPQSACQRWTEAIRRNRDLQRATANDGGIKEVAVLRIIHRIAQHASHLASAEHSFVHARSISRGNNQKRAVNVAR